MPDSEETWVEVIVHHPGKQPLRAIYESDVEIHIPRRTVDFHDTKQRIAITAWHRTVPDPPTAPANKED